MFGFISVVPVGLNLAYGNNRPKMHPDNIGPMKRHVGPCSGGGFKQWRSWIALTSLVQHFV
jgi:hypothetical protein